MGVWIDAQQGELPAIVQPNEGSDPTETRSGIPGGWSPASTPSPDGANPRFGADAAGNDNLTTGPHYAYKFVQGSFRVRYRRYNVLCHDDVKG